MQAYQTSQDVVPSGGIFLGKWRSSFAGSSDGKNECPISLRSEHPIYMIHQNFILPTRQMLFSSTFFQSYPLPLVR
jgi:hypothetical protein